MEKFTVHKGLVAPMDRENVDTDAIIPKQFLKSIQKTGFGPNLFDEWRYLDKGEPGQDVSRRKLNPDFVLNQPRYEGASVLLAAADTFRAAAREQLMVWAERSAVDIVSQEGGDPAAVSFDAVSAGKARGKDVVLVDTAGRLPTQLHLMEELKKIRRVIAKADAQAPHEVLLVIDGNTGQNALAQVKAFDEALGLTGLIVTKLDGTAKGGVLAAIALWARERSQNAQDKRPLSVYFVGVGEKLEDLETFKAREFAQALLG